MSTKELLKENVDALTKNSPSYSLVLWNDDINTFDWVIAALVEICEMAEMQAEQCSLILHYKGKCAVLEGDYKSLKPKCNAITDRGIQASIEQLTAK